VTNFTPTSILSCLRVSVSFSIILSGEFIHIRALLLDVYHQLTKYETCQFDSISSPPEKNRTDKRTMDSSTNDIRVGTGPILTDNHDVATENNLLAPSPSVLQRDSQSGIDIRQALDILASRTPHHHSPKHGSPCCGGGDSKPPPPALKSMGQTIDMFAPSSDSPHSSSESTAQKTTTTSTSGANAVTPAEQRQTIRDSLKDLPFIALLKMVLTAQEDRVRTYRLYDEALGKVLVSNRLTDYPPACLAATAAFSVLSNTISAVREELSDRVDSKIDPLILTSTSSSVMKWIRDLQESERQKLQLTAAYHLERIRANDLKPSNTSDDYGNYNENDDDGEVDMRELSLLNNGIADLRSRIETCRSDINSIIEDLRCTLVEQMEEEEQ
jgi:hypothetical protein